VSGWIITWKEPITSFTFCVMFCSWVYDILQVSPASVTCSTSAHFMGGLHVQAALLSPRQFRGASDCRDAHFQFEITHIALYVDIARLDPSLNCTDTRLECATSRIAWSPELSYNRKWWINARRRLPTRAPLGSPPTKPMQLELASDTKGGNLGFRALLDLV
jgi:hypothetical protein